MGLDPWALNDGDKGLKKRRGGKEEERRANLLDMFAYAKLQASVMFLPHLTEQLSVAVGNLRPGLGNLPVVMSLSSRGTHL